MRTRIPYALLGLLLGCSEGGDDERLDAAQNGSLDGSIEQGDGDGDVGSNGDASAQPGADGSTPGDEDASLPGDGSGFAVGPASCTAAKLEAGASLDGYQVDRYSWSDATCARRSAALVRNNAQDPGGSRGGYMRALTWSAGGVERRAVGGDGTWRGFGFVVNHYGDGADTSVATGGSYRSVLSGQHHAIHEFKLEMHPGGTSDVTVQWFFATGRSAPIYAITFDLSRAGQNTIYADTRAPYGEIPFEGEVTEIGGVGWGDAYRFVTTGNGPVTMQTAWDYRERNVVPYTRMWSMTVDAEMGLVQTEAFDKQIGGGDYGSGVLADCQGKTSQNRGQNCTTNGETMPQSWLWPFQMNQYELPFTTYSHRMAWGSTYGAIGQASVQSFGRSIVGYPRVSYSVHVVVDPKSTDPTLDQALEVEHALGAGLTATEGKVATSGPGGVGRTDSQPYDVAGYNPVFGVFELEAAGGRVTASLDPRGGALKNPIFHVRGVTQLNRVLLNQNVLPAAAYFATLDAAKQELWLTLNGSVSKAVTLHVE